jgi:hypothetical protein
VADYRLELTADQAGQLPEPLRVVDTLAQDPVVNWWRETAHTFGLGQEQFMNATHGYLKLVAAEAQKAQTEAMTALGADADTRIAAAGLWIDRHLPAEQAAALKSATASAPMLQAIETLMGKTSPPLAGGSGQSHSPGPGGIKSLAELRQMQKDPRYSGRNADPAYIAEVRREYARAFPGQVAS